MARKISQNDNKRDLQPQRHEHISLKYVIIGYSQYSYAGII